MINERIKKIEIEKRFEIVPDEPAMTDYKETLYSFGDQEDGITIPGWDLISVDYENYSYVENDGYPYTGFMLYLKMKYDTK